MLETSPNKREELYKEHLQELSGIAFTCREIDIIACALHNRGEKRIASMLSISYRTVGAHVRNIMLKISCNSRDQVIDFVEKSGKLQYFNQHYFHLVIKSFFETQLKKIGSIINRNEVFCLFDSGHVTSEEWELIGYLEEHLKLANITLVKAEDIDNKPENKHKNILYNIYLAGERFTGNYGKITGDNVVLLVGGNNDINEFKDINYIDFRLNSQYYLAMLELIEKITHKENLEQIIRNFKVEYEKLQQSLSGNSSLSELVSRLESKPFSGKKKLLLLSLSCLIIGTASFLYLYFRPKNQDITEINKEFAAFVKSYSFDNIGVSQGLKPNIDLLIKAGNVVSNLDHQYMLDYFKGNKALKEELLNYLCNVHAIAMNALYNECDELKARKLLENAKDIIESYVMNKGNTKIDFNEIAAEEIYTELDIVDGLPEMYTKILYLLGRTYTYFEEYNRSDEYFLQIKVEDVERYYELSAYLGNKLKTFEGFLSVRNGIEMARLFRIKSNIKSGNYNHAREEILKSISVLEKLRHDNTKYILDYRPDNRHKIIVPAKDNYCKLFVTEQIVNQYLRLIRIAEDKNEQLLHVDKISSYFFGDKGKTGVFSKLEQVPDKKVACLYNSLGYILLQLVRQKVDFCDFKARIKERLSLTTDDELELIAQLFNLAKTKSRNSYYPKGDSYDGLIAAYTEMLKRGNITKQEAEELKTQIDSLKQKRDKLNTQLKRKSL